MSRPFAILGNALLLILHPAESGRIGICRDQIKTQLTKSCIYRQKILYLAEKAKSPKAIGYVYLGDAQLQNPLSVSEELMNCCETLGSENWETLSMAFRGSVLISAGYLDNGKAHVSCIRLLTWRQKVKVERPYLWFPPYTMNDDSGY